MPSTLHAAVGFYLNGDYQIEYIGDEDLESYIAYNSKYRFGRFHFIDGEYVCGGVLEQPYQDAFITKCKQRLAKMNLTTIKPDSFLYSPHRKPHMPQRFR